MNGTKRHGIAGLVTKFCWSIPGCAIGLAALLISVAAANVLRAQGAPAAAGTAPSLDQHVLCYLLGEQTLQEHAAAVCRQARLLPAEQRFETLARWVLPGDGHAFRLKGEFRRCESPEGQAEVVSAGTMSSLHDYPESDWIRSPAIDLIKAATQLGRLDELTQRIENFKTSDREQAQNITTLLSLIDIAQGDVKAVAQRLEERIGWQRNAQKSGSALQRWPDLLVLWSAAANRSTSHLVREELFGAFPMLQYYNEDVDLDVVNDYLRLLKGRCHDLALRSEGSRLSEESAPQSSRFDAFSLVDAASHAQARPLARFYVGAAGAHKITGHEMDYLAYSGPITGNFEVNCEVATRAGAFTELMVHAAATQPVDNGNRIRVGSLARSDREISIQPPLEEIESLSHLRVVVRDSVATHFFNGRPVFESSVDPSSAPWIALRSWRRTNSEIRNLQLVGSPNIAETIELLADSSLSGWAAYYDSGENQGLGNWKALEDADGSIQLISDVTGPVRGSYDEDLIRYVRSIAWDARIRYEFAFHPGQIGVHPCLGRSVFLITPEGVRRHRLTDGKHDPSGLRPDNASDLDSEYVASSVGLDLKEGWNEVELQISGDQLTLLLNGRSVAQTRLTGNQSRTFGFFHYRDQTRAVVRNVSLAGDWPKTLPSIQEQPLASKTVRELDVAASELPVNFVHDFQDGIPPELFDFNGDETTMRLRPDGVRMARSTSAGVKEMRVAAIIEGDFDIVAGYKDLEISTGDPTWHCGVGLAFNLDNPTRDRCAINRRRDRMHGHHYVAFGQKETNAGGKTRWTGGANVVDESTSGRLRLVRQGTKVYGLHAIGDSPSFRVVATSQVPPGPIAMHGLRFITDVGKGLETHVTWSKLEIRAEQVDLLTVDDQHKTLAMLDEQRQRKASSMIDLTKRSLTDAGVVSTTSDGSVVLSGAEGATVTVRSDESLERCGLLKSIALGHEFDVQVDFRVLRLDRGIKMGASSEVVLQVRLDDPQDNDPASEELQIYEASIMLRHKANGKLDLIPRVAGRGRGGKTVYLPIRSVPVKMPDQYRIAQRNQTLYFMYSEEKSPDTRIIATYPLGRDLSASALALWTIASRGERVATTCWKQICVHGVAGSENPLMQGSRFQQLQPDDQ